MTTIIDKKYFRKIWVLENNDSIGLKKTGPMISDGCLELIFVSGNGYRATFDSKEVFCGEGVYLGGHLDEKLELEVLPHTKMTFVKLQPWTASLISNFHYQQSLNQTIPLVELNKSLYEKIINFDLAKLNDDLLSVIGKEIEYRLVKHRDFELIYHGSQLLETHYRDFKCAKDHLLQETGFSSRTLETKFSQYIGLTPQKFTNTIKFRNITEDIFHGRNDESLTYLAYKYGYYDQAHFIRNCQRLLGISPKSLSSENCFITNSKEPFRYYTI